MVRYWSHLNTDAKGEWMLVCPSGRWRAFLRSYSMTAISIFAPILKRKMHFVNKWGSKMWRSMQLSSQHHLEPKWQRMPLKDVKERANLTRSALQDTCIACATSALIEEVDFIISLLRLIFKLFSEDQSYCSAKAKKKNKNVRHWDPPPPDLQPDRQEAWMSYYTTQKSHKSCGQMSSGSLVSLLRR